MTPQASTGGDENLDFVVQEQLFGELSIGFNETGMMEANTKIDSFFQRIVFDSSQIELKVLLIHMQKSSRILFHATKLIRSLAVNRVCRRDGTNTMTGLEGLWFLTAKNVGRFIDCINGQKPLTSGNPSI